MSRGERPGVCVSSTSDAATMVACNVRSVAMSLYRHDTDNDDILDGTVEAVFAAIERPATDATGTPHHLAGERSTP